LETGNDQRPSGGAEAVTGLEAAALIVPQVIGLLSFIDETLNQPALSDEQRQDLVNLQKGSVRAALDATERMRQRRRAEEGGS
jgi:hypothetical protein